jgi:hypothetical protein
MPYQLPQACPHCPEYPDWTELEDHIAAAHSDLPACTATLTAEYTDGTVRCAFRVGHRSEDFGDWHGRCGTTAYRVPCRMGTAGRGWRARLGWR